MNREQAITIAADQALTDFPHWQLGATTEVTHSPEGWYVRIHLSSRGEKRAISALYGIYYSHSLLQCILFDTIDLPYQPGPYSY